MLRDPWASPGIGQRPPGLLLSPVCPRGWRAAGLAARHTWLWGAGLRGPAPQRSTGPGPPVLLVLALCSPAPERVGGGPESGLEAPSARLSHHMGSRPLTCCQEALPPVPEPRADGPGGTGLRLPPPLGCSPSPRVRARGSSSRRPVLAARSRTRARPVSPRRPLASGCGRRLPVSSRGRPSSSSPPLPVKAPVGPRFTSFTSLKARSPHRHVRKSWGQVWGLGPATAATPRGPGPPTPTGLTFCVWRLTAASSEQRSWPLLATFVGTLGARPGHATVHVRSTWHLLMPQSALAPETPGPEPPA